jgi:hypothetical protein
VLFGGAAGFVPVWPTTVVLWGVGGFSVDFGVSGCHGFRAGDLGGTSPMVQFLGGRELGCGSEVNVLRLAGAWEVWWLCRWVACVLVCVLGHSLDGSG